MKEYLQGGNNRNLITILITLVVLVVVAVIYWDRQNNRAFQASLMEEWEQPLSQQRVNSAFNATPIAFTKQVSYKAIVARIAPSVVSVDVGASFINQSPVAQAQPIWGMGNGMGNASAGATGGYLCCPNCYTTVPCPRAGQGNMVNCPSCGTCMRQGGMPGCPFSAQSQQQSNQNQPAGMLNGSLDLGQYVWGGRMGGRGMGPGGFLVCPNCSTQTPHQRGVPAYMVNCPNCGTQMMRQGAPGAYGAYSAPAGTQQAANIPNDNQFQALGKGGSGVIVDSRGYVLTNHHVIHGARNITVSLSFGGVSKTYPAELIDEAPDVDFAILKIVANGEVFTPAPIGNSSTMSVGDEVLAIGSPFGLQQTVTAGIISNTKRTMSVGNRTFTNFFQIDAPINPGSSGGPLINVNGEVVGITTAIYSPTQAFSGIGFASPIDPAKAAFPDFIDATSNASGILGAIPNWARGPALQQAANTTIQRGQGLYPWCPPGGRGGQMQQAANTTIQRGQGLYPWCPPGGPVGRMRQMAATSTQPWLGIRINAVDKQTREFLGLPMGYGVLVMEVYNNSPCMAAGLQRGDVIFRADGQSVKDEVMFEALLSQKKVGDKVNLTAYRDGKKMSFTVNLSAALWPKTAGTGAVLQAQAVALPAVSPKALPNEPFVPFDPELVPPPGLTGVLQGSEVGAGEIEALGMGVEELVPELALAYGIPKGIVGLIVAESATQAAAAGLLAGDVIESINGQRVETIVDFIKVMNKASLRKGVSLDVYRQGQRFNIQIKN